MKVVDNGFEVTNKATGEVVFYSEAEHTKKRDELLVAWQNSKDALEKAKEAEIALRNEVVNFTTDDAKESGTVNVDLGKGYTLKAVKKINYNFVKNADNKLDKTAIEKALQKIEKDGADGVLIADRLVKWTPDLSLTEYKQLSEKHKKIIDDILVITDATPTLEIKEPKNK